VKGFDTTADEDSIREGLSSAFGEFGAVADIRLPFDRENQCLKGFGYVVFESADGAAVRSPYS
jgi:RNA recognition motif-containing protein